MNFKTLVFYYHLKLPLLCPCKALRITSLVHPDITSTHPEKAVQRIPVFVHLEVLLCSVNPRGVHLNECFENRRFLCLLIMLVGAKHFLA